MTAGSPQNLTQLLQAWSDGDPSALEELVPIVEAELLRLAQHYLRQERPGHTLQPTALVNEAYLRLMEWNSASWQNRSHFFGVAANVMRRILVDHARRYRYLKRGGEMVRVMLDEDATVSSPRDADLVALDEALQDLAAIDLRKSQIVEMRFFGGLSVEETADVLKISARTVKREWSLARAWLYDELSEEEKDDA